MSLKVWLPLDGDLRNLGCSDVTVTNNGTTVNDGGKIGKCYSFDGQSHYLTIPNLPMTKTMSFALWYKPSITTSSIPNGYHHIFDGRLNGSGQEVLCLESPSFKAWNVHTSEILNQDTWYHICVINNNGQVTIYVNGHVSVTGTTSMISEYITTLYIGARYTGTNTLAEKMNDIRIYDHCLSAAEVHEIAMGLVLHYKLDRNGFGNPNLLANSKLDGSWTYPSSSYSDKYFPITTSIPTASQYTLSFEAKSTVSGDKIRTHYYSPNTTTTCVSSQGVSKSASDGNMDFTLTTNWKKYWVIYSQNETTAVKHIICPRLVSGNGTGTVSVRNVKLEEGNIATPWCPNVNDDLYKILGMDDAIIEDSSGYGHNGTIINAPTISSDTSKYSSSINFNGTTDGILIENLNISNIINTAVTYSFWIKPNGENGARSVYFGSHSGTSWSIEKTSGNVLRSYWNGSPDETCSNATITDGVWQHICIVKDRTNSIKVYINGVQKWTSTATHNNLTFPTTFRIGRDSRSNDGTPYKGQMSDFRIYCTPLLDNDIKMLYNIGMKVDNLGEVHTFELNENSSKNKLTKTGVLNNNIIEPYLTLPDGSNWKLILYHYVDNGNNLFTSSNATYCNDFGLYSRLKDINNYTYNGKYEFYVNQDGKEFRWTQTSQPTASSIAGLAIVEGYNNPVHGLAKANQSNTYIGYDAWWGACGCWTKFSAGGKTGIPGFGSPDANGICEKYLTLYVRVEKNNASFENSSTNSTEFIEI